MKKLILAISAVLLSACATVPAGPTVAYQLTDKSGQVKMLDEPCTAPEDVAVMNSKYLSYMHRLVVDAKGKHAEGCWGRMPKEMGDKFLIVIGGNAFDIERGDFKDVDPSGIIPLPVPEHKEKSNVF